uniref:Uncharacterized protein n=2 Tax=Oryza sativa subsp. japonica TaxID=39947 RepID=Q10R57_ORYSJ|nr:hypothetical protein [Oryza sativa Japonica Group]ABF94209.1 hypothetical protein LOC_Os03g07460 [Oryza sativa Japonica Group]
MGGLGVLDLDKFARALRLRWLWFEWECPDKPWVGTTPHYDELDEQIFVAATKVTIGNGQKAKFWTSNWIGHQPLKYLAPALFNHSKGKQRLVQDALTNDKWIEDIRHELSMPLIREFFAVFRLIWDNETNLEEGVEDTITWRWTNTGYGHPTACNSDNGPITTFANSATGTWKRRNIYSRIVHSREKFGTK